MAAKKTTKKAAKEKAPKSTTTTSSPATQVPAGATGTGPIRFAGFPAAVLYDKIGKGRKALRQLLWGDWMRVTGDPREGFLPVHARGVDGFIDEKQVSEERLLEVIFVDIGQGDGSLVITPDDRHIVIDAGEGDNMLRFLRWRYGRFEKDFVFDAAIMSHSDLDHYGGFAGLLKQPKVRFKAVYTNGLMERPSEDDDGVLGDRKTENGVPYIDDLVGDMAALKKFVADPANVGKKKYPSMFKAALAANKIDDFKQLSVADKHVPGFGPDSVVTLNLLGPVVETCNGKPALRWFGDVGKTKNGHSVVVKLKYRNVTMLLGGDLNIPSEGLLLQHHTGAAKVPKTEAQREALAGKARSVFQCDIAKSCHHGSADFSRAFLSAVNPFATVISSGDDEAYSHPRADALGTIGKYSRGLRPLIFSTELARSAPERIKHPVELHAKIDVLLEEAGAAKNAADKARLKKKVTELKEQLERSVAVYGAINVRTDGRRVVVAQRMEAMRKKNKQWDIYTMIPDGSDELAFVSKHEGEHASDDE